MSIQPVMETYTVQDYLQWEGDWELIYGQPMAMAPSPVYDHQQLSALIFRQLDESLDDCPNCQALFEIDVEFSKDTVVRPDVLVICYQPEGDRLTRAPDLIFEVISPISLSPCSLPEGERDAGSLREFYVNAARRDEVVKFELYRQEGVTHYVLAYPDEKKAKVWRLVDGEYRKVADFHDETHHFELSKCAFDFDFSRLWRRKGDGK